MAESCPRQHAWETMEDQPRKRQNNRCSSLVQMLQEFCGYTSCGGLGRIVGTKFLVFKVLWVMLFLAAVGMAISQLIPLFYKYRSRPVSTRLSLHYSGTLDFPSVVLCNFNMIRASAIEKLPYNIAQILGSYLPDENEFRETNDDIEAHHDDDENENNSREEESKNERKNQGSVNGPTEPHTLDKVYKAEERLSVLMAPLDKKMLMRLGHQFDDMIRSCTFKGKDCRNFTKYWEKFWHYKFGNCYVFNPLKKRDKSQEENLEHVIASKPGPLYGLSVAMDVEQHEYIDELTHTAGIAVLISKRGKMFFPYEEGLSIAPGFSTSLGLRMVQIYRQDRFGNNSCISDDGVSNEENIYTGQFGVTYSKTACEQTCLAHAQKKHCDCMEYKFPGEEGQKYCDILNETVVSCLREVAEKARNRQLECSHKCRPLCSDQVFKVSSSFSAWPSVKYQKYLSREWYTPRNDSGKTRGTFSNNYLKIQIYFQDMNFEVIEEEILYKIENFLSDIGGQLGLWIGISCLSGIEVLELIAFMVIQLLSKKNRVNLDNLVAMEEGTMDHKSKN